MKTQKVFDCVEMKREIQQRLLQEEAELGKDEARKRREQRILADPVLGPFLKRALAAEHHRRN
jgi:hypothetical protein